MRCLLMIVTILLQGCHSTSPVGKTDVRPGAGQSQMIETVLAGLSDRADLMKTLHGWGVIELQWQDEAGAHFEQGDLEFWLDGQDRLAVRVSKLGDTYFWIGTDGQDAWVFDLSERPKRLLVSSMKSILENGSANDSWISIMDMIQMMQAGLGALPPPSSSDVLSLTATDEEAWVLVCRDPADADRQIQFRLDPDTWRPLEVSLINNEGVVLLQAGTRSARTRRLEIPGRPSVACPIVSAVIEVRDRTAEDGLARFAFEGLTSDLSDQPMERLFDLKALKAGLRPEIEGSLVPTGSQDHDSSSH